MAHIYHQIPEEVKKIKPLFKFKSLGGKNEENGCANSNQSDLHKQEKQ